MLHLIGPDFANIDRVKRTDDRLLNAAHRAARADCFGHCG